MVSSFYCWYCRELDIASGRSVPCPYLFTYAKYYGYDLIRHVFIIKKKKKIDPHFRRFVETGQKQYTIRSPTMFDKKKEKKLFGEAHENS